MIGKNGDQALAELRAAHPHLSYVSVPEGSMVTMDMRMDRVRVWVGQDGNVAKAPKIG
jgi:hypothetical protein